MQTVAKHSQGDYCSSSESKKSEKINQKGALSAVYRAERVSQPKIPECVALSALGPALSATCNLQRNQFCTRPPVCDDFMPKSCSIQLGSYSNAHVDRKSVVGKECRSRWSP